MSDTTHIAWCHHTASPWYGCRKVSEGCVNCYMFAWMKRAGLDTSKRHRSKSFDKQCRKWDRQAHVSHDLERPRVFPSLCDPFDTEAPLEWFNDMMVTVDACRDIDFLLLTKRPENVMPLWSKVLAHWGRTDTALPPNVWLGVTCENQATANKRVPILREIPAKTRWLSIEPILERINLEMTCTGCHTCDFAPHWHGVIDWVVVGGESGPNYRDIDVKCIIDIANQCEWADKVPCFVKQDAYTRPGKQGRIPESVWRIKEFPLCR